MSNSLFLKAKWMLLRRFFSLLMLGLLAISLAGCAGPARILGGNATAMVSSIRRLSSRITNPVRPDARLAVLWVGHATVLVQMDDRFILTDPIFTENAGRISQRLVEPGLAPEHVPPIDAVLISHMHFDHLSVGTLEILAPKIRHLFVPEQGLVYVPDFGFPASELRRWEEQDTQGLSITAVPVAHSGWRYGADIDWHTKSFTGYVIRHHGLTVYFGGDTAYTKADFIETKRRFPNIDLAILPIAPIHPRTMMKKRHMDPIEAVQAYQDLGARWMVPMHFETFINSSDEPGEPERVLRQAMRDQHLTEAEINILQIGQQRVFIAKNGDGAPSSVPTSPKTQ